MSRRIGILKSTSYNTTLPSSVYIYPYTTSLELNYPKTLIPIDTLENRYSSFVNLGAMREALIKMDGLASPSRSMTQILGSFLDASTTQMDASVRWRHTFTPKTSSSSINCLKVFFDVDNLQMRGSPFLVKRLTFDAKAKDVLRMSLDMQGLLSSDSTTPTINNDNGNILSKLGESGWHSFKFSISPNDDHAYTLDQNAYMKWGAYDLDIEVETLGNTHLNNALNNNNVNLTFSFLGGALGTYYYAIVFNLNDCILNLISTTKSKEVELYKYKVIPTTWSIDVHNDQSSI